ncbi:deoxyguanosinetriphosphate triphosphohydrolase [Acinetobacter bohemicus]|uniref:deoxyguanosinetriphosphate triphosphohydrolase n=1 Tax=unclassified Acinetobacter TaxID=196816 RepID=UPI0011901005|nr:MULTISPECIES: deoxyguanosinetriphosphate triphosphohydrolase [unclassified Acinetobacter]MCO8044647.1 deoxyguanosinetriphosphate triphosphohydrolase [Acinetobacter sp. S4397-1]TSH77738.1 deoxyguanosinetriphosphate triphosphohydrolase [Acinetobacter sp. RF15A]TSI21174.1 deoxyguanosinetriphosphate triphosphohydrolase [Acinetobacter sp. RF15B]
MTQMRWLELLSTVRIGSKKQSTELARSPFHKDYDRIIFSQSFRQLNRKTQVHPLTQHDGIHTRLTHSLEVSCIGRSLGMLAAEKIKDRLPPWISPADVGAIIQAACLAHDIGNPPFGHAGEYAIREWFDDVSHTDFLKDLSPEQEADVRQFEGNAQGLRLLTKIDYHPNDGGMRLTYATLGAYLKYPWLSKTIASQGDRPASQRAKFGCYQAEKDILKQIAEELGLIQLDEYQYCRHPLTYLLEAADDICYALIDLEDGISLNMLSYEEVEPVFLNLLGDYGVPSEIAMENTTWQQKIAALRGRVMKRLVNEVTTAFARHHDQILSGQLQGGLLQYCTADIESGIDRAKELARDRIFEHPQKAGLEIIAHQCLQNILDAFIPLTIPHKTLSFKEQRLMSILQRSGANFTASHYENIMQVLDIISKFSDHQAYNLSQELQGNKVGLL